MQLLPQHDSPRRCKPAAPVFRQRLVAAVAGALLTVTATSQAAEIDSFTQRRQPLPDATGALNQWFNQRLQAGIKLTNDEMEDGCEPEQLYDNIRVSFASPFVGHLIAEELDQSSAIPKQRVPLNQSIYRDLGLIDAISMHIKDLSGVMNVQGTLVGSDKLGHFVVEGWSYYKRAYLDLDGLEDALQWGAFTERTYFGLMTTGIYSYADLAANFDGMRFWIHLLGEGRDPVDSEFLSPLPYIKCKRRFWTGEHYWKLVRRVHVEDYVNPAWDEAVNCQDYRNPEIAILVNRRILRQTPAGAPSRVCPVAPKACRNAADHYGEYSRHLINTRCLEAAPASRPWWKLW